MKGVEAMLYIYDKFTGLPGDKKYIEDVETWFSAPKNRTLDVDGILRDAEKGSYCDTEYFYDRFGGRLYWFFLSSGSKGALIVANNPDWIVDMKECGDNVLECLIRNKINGNIYVDSIYRVISIPAYEVQNKLYYNDEEFNNIAELSKWRKYGHK